MMYRKKSLVEAFRFGYEEAPEWFDNRVSFCDKDHGFIETLEGVLRFSKGDYIIQNTGGEIYPCKYDIFLETYEKVEDDESEYHC